jgi:RNA polymerase sigma-70 factor, ECF subfamily
MRDEHDAQDVVQEACLRAVRHFDGYRGGDARAWLLTIVRHSCYTWLRRGRDGPTMVELDDAIVGQLPTQESPESSFEERTLADELRVAIDQLPREFKETIVLREVEGLSYDEISRVLGVPRGTVMSRLSRARKRLQTLIAHPLRETG